jgi:hypothetical protein
VTGKYLYEPSREIETTLYDGYEAYDNELYMNILKRSPRRRQSVYIYLDSQFAYK